MDYRTGSLLAIFFILSSAIFVLAENNTLNETVSANSTTTSLNTTTSTTTTAITTTTKTTTTIKQEDVEEYWKERRREVNITYEILDNHSAIYCTASPCIASSELIRSVDSVDVPEPNQPNTIDGCLDGTYGTYLSDESVENITITDLDDTRFRPGDTVRVDVWVYCYNTLDNINFVYANNSDSPSWIVKGYDHCSVIQGFEKFSRIFTLNSVESNHAFRALIEFDGAVDDTCGRGLASFDDADDVTFYVGYGEPPSVSEIQCSNGAAWMNCSSISYGDNLTAVRANCSDFDGYITDATFLLKNIPDDHTFFGGEGTPESGWWVYDNTDFIVEDSGEWLLSVTCTDNDMKSAKTDVFWTIPWGRLESYLIDPISAMSVFQNDFFNFSAGVKCVGGECENVTAILDPQGEYYAQQEGTSIEKNKHKVEVSVLEKLRESSKVPVIVFLRDDKDKKTLRSSINSLDDFDLKREYTTVDAFAGRLGEQDLRILMEDSRVESIYFDRILEISLSESVPLINADDVWGIRIGGKNVTGQGQTVCIIDTGIDYTHPDLGGCTQSEFLSGNCDKVLGGYDFYNEDSNPMDDHSHGTHCAGIATANGALKGVAPGASLVAVKVCSEYGGCPDSDIAAGIEWCTLHREEYNISVISMSLGDSVKHNSPCDGDSLAPFINAAVGEGIFVAVASGNNGWHDGISSPACISNATSVGSTTKSDTISSFSNTGIILDLLAPGSSIYSTVPGGYGYKSGTSMATPHVAGAAALLKQYRRSLTPEEVRTYLKSTGKNITDSVNGLDFPRIDVFAAVKLMDWKGVVPMYSGTPFYTISKNPQNCLDMHAGDSCNLSWRVNATGSGGTWMFYVTYNPSPPVGGNETDRVNVTIIDNSAPVIGNVSAVSTTINSTVITWFTDDLSNSTIYYGTSPSALTLTSSSGLFVALHEIALAGLDSYTTHYFNVSSCNPDGYCSTSGVHNFTTEPMPVSINQIECRNDTAWTDCGNLLYGSNLTQVGVNCTSEDGNIVGVTFSLENVPDMNVFFIGNASAAGGIWIFDNPDIIIEDSGVWNLSVFCWDDLMQESAGSVSWLVPWGRLEPYLINMSFQMDVTQDEFFNFSSGVGCVGGECGNVSAALDPVMFFDNMESGINGWTYEGLWHLTEDDSYSPTHSWWYGNETTGNYDTGSRNYGGLVSPLIDLPYIENATLRFRYWYQTEDTGSSWDQRWVQVRIGNGSWQPLKQLSGDAMGVWHERSINLTPYCGNQIQIRFYFDTIDSLFNYYKGWLIDDVVIESGGSLKGVVPMLNGTPFYTVDQNPVICENMLHGDSCTHSWRVNAAGNVSSSWDFFTIYSPITYSFYIPVNETDRVNVSITGGVPPLAHDVEVALDYVDSVNGILLEDDGVVLLDDPAKLSTEGLYDLKYKVRNLGEDNESVNITVLVSNSTSSSVIKSRQWSLCAGEYQYGSEGWNTSGMEPGAYNLTVNVSIIGDSNLSNNLRTRQVYLLFPELLNDSFLTVCAYGCNYTHIQDAVDAAQSGYTILVGDGTYTENIEVYKSLNIRSVNGAEHTIVEAEDIHESIFHVRADNTNISGFTINGSSYYGGNIYLDNADECNIAENIISADYVGIEAFFSNNVVIRENTITSKNDADIYISYAEGNILEDNTFMGGGLLVYHTYDNIVTNNTVNGKPLVYLEDESNQSITEAGQVILILCRNITVEGVNITDVVIGAYFANCAGCSIVDSRIAYCNQGIYLDNSDDTLLINNNITENAYYGVRLTSSDDNRIIDNLFSWNPEGLYFSNSQGNVILENTFIGGGLSLHDTMQNTVFNNTVNGKPLVYLKDEEDTIISDAGQVFLLNCENITVQGLNISDTNLGVQLLESYNCNIEQNNISRTLDYGIGLKDSYDNRLYGNVLSENLDSGILLEYSNRNSLQDNKVLETDNIGIYLRWSDKNEIIGNIIENNDLGIESIGRWNVIKKNNITGNDGGIDLRYSNNILYLNNFIDNEEDIDFRDDTNILNSPKRIIYTHNGTHIGYLGNYWDTYSDVDSNGDGVWDNPYVMDDAVDNYPLVDPSENYVEEAPPFDIEPPRILMIQPESGTELPSDTQNLTVEIETDEQAVCRHTLGSELVESEGTYNNIHCLFDYTLNVEGLKNPSHEMREYISINESLAEYVGYTVNLEEGALNHYVYTGYIPMQDLTRNNGSKIPDFEYRGKMLFQGETYFVKDISLNEITLAKGEVKDDITNEAFGGEYMGYSFRIDHLVYSGPYVVNAMVLDVRKPNGTIEQILLNRTQNGVVDDIEMRPVYAEAAGAVETASMIVYDKSTEMILEDGEPDPDNPDWTIVFDKDSQPFNPDMDIAEYEDIDPGQYLLRGIYLRYDENVTLYRGDSITSPWNRELFFDGINLHSRIPFENIGVLFDSTNDTNHETLMTDFTDNRYVRAHNYYLFCQDNESNFNYDYWELLTYTVVDDFPPIISSIQVHADNDSARVSWITDEYLSNTLLEYGKTTGYGQIREWRRCYHQVGGTYSCYTTLEDLTPSTTYHFRINATDRYDNTATTEDGTFTTAEAHVEIKFNGTANQTQTLNLSEIDMMLELHPKTNFSATADIILYSNSPTAEFSVLGLGRYFDLSLTGYPWNWLDWAFIKVYYTDEEVKAAGLKEKSLRFYWYNESSGEWVMEENSGVDTKENFVWANLSHFSYYAIGGESQTGPPAVNPPVWSRGGSGGGGGGTGGAKPKISCFDGILNCHDGGCEEDIDCGGPCDPCMSCSDGIQNQGETGIDCGGPCPPCETTTTTTTTTKPKKKTTTTTTLTTATTLQQIDITGKATTLTPVDGEAIIGASVILTLIGSVLYWKKQNKGQDSTP